MNWMLLGIISAITVTVATLIEKKVLFNIHAATYSTAVTAINALCALLLLPIMDIQNITYAGWAFIALLGVTDAVGYLFIAKAMRREEVSYVSPMLNFSPAITAVLAYFFLSEKLTTAQAAGIMLIVLGAYGLHASHNHGMIATAKKFFSSRAQNFVWFALLLYGFGSIGSKHLLNQGINPITLLALLHIMMTLTLFTILAVKYEGFNDLKSCWQTAGFTVLIAGLFMFASRMALFTAMGITSIALVMGIKRMSSLLVTILGGEMFHENNLRHRITAASVMLVGVVMLV